MKSNQRTNWFRRQIISAAPSVNFRIRRDLGRRLGQLATIVVSLMVAWSTGPHLLLGCNVRAAEPKFCFDLHPWEYCTPHCSYHWCSWRAWVHERGSHHHTSVGWCRWHLHRSCGWVGCKRRRLGFSSLHWSGLSWPLVLGPTYFHLSPCFQIYRPLCWIALL